MIIRKINKIIVHCSATLPDAEFESIRSYHKYVNKWSDIGYHYVIDHKGIIHHGRDVDSIGAHCAGHNIDSIGVCLIGGKQRFDFSFRQLVALRDLLEDLCKSYSLTKEDIYPHYKFNVKKECPRFSVKNFLLYEDF